MKRIKAACICQTLHFQLNENLDHAMAAAMVEKEVKKYKDDLLRNRTMHRIVSEERQSDDSVLLKIIKQYNSSPVGDYLD